MPAATSLACKGSMVVDPSGSSSLSGVKVARPVLESIFRPSDPRAESYRTFGDVRLMTYFSRFVSTRTWYHVGTGARSRPSA